MNKITSEIRMYFMGCKTFKDAVERLFNDFVEGIKNLIYWFPIIWNDRQWDHTYLTKMMLRKLSKMEEYFRNGHFYENQEKDAANMKICVDCFKRLIDDEYDDIAFKEHNEKWGRLDMKFWDPKQGENFGEVTFSRPNAITEEQKEQESKEYIEHMEAAEKMQEDDLDLVFGTMRKELLRWWE
jgi:hypothetical protein